MQIYFLMLSLKLLSFQYSIVQMGKFYELFEMDAHVGAKELDLQYMKVLLGRGL